MPKASEKTVFINVDDGREKYGLTTWLYADDGFETWKTTASTKAEKSLANEYSSYTIKMFCDISQIKLYDDLFGKVGFGCCLRDLTQQGGGYCLRLKSN